MEDNSTKVTEEVTESGERTEVVDPSTENHDDFALVDEETGKPAETEEKSDDGKAEPVTQQSEEDNRAARLARLKAERDAEKREAERKAGENRRFRESGAINPLTGKPFESWEEFEAYGKQAREARLKEEAEKSGKTVKEVEEEEEVRAELAKKKAGEAPETKEDGRIKDEIIEIMEKHPEVDVDNLIRNEKFLKFCGSRFGKESLNGLYEDYASLVNDAKESAKADTRAQRTTGTGVSGGDRLTAAQRRSLDAWNEANPDMQMTPSEYLHS